MMTDDEQRQAAVALLAWFCDQEIEGPDAVVVMVRLISAIGSSDPGRRKAGAEIIGRTITEMIELED